MLSSTVRGRVSSEVWRFGESSTSNVELPKTVEGSRATLSGRIEWSLKTTFRKCNPCFAATDWHKGDSHRIDIWNECRVNEYFTAGWFNHFPHFSVDQLFCASLRRWNPRVKIQQEKKSWLSTEWPNIWILKTWKLNEEEKNWTANLCNLILLQEQIKYSRYSSGIIDHRKYSTNSEPIKFQSFIQQTLFFACSSHARKINNVRVSEICAVIWQIKFIAF